MIDYTQGDLLELVQSVQPDGVDALVDLYSDGPALAEMQTRHVRGKLVISME